MGASAENYPDIQEYLFSLKAAGVRFGIDRMRGLAGALGHPEKKVPVVHLAGTNGKGSVAAMLEQIFREAGWKTGLYTSPHLVKLGERVQVNRVPLSEEKIMAYVREFRPLMEELGRNDADGKPSFFELMTAMAFLEFSRENCDIAFVETGLGGRLDATNIVDPEATVITSVGLDHCEILGTSLGQIAREKAGIIKKGRPLVIGWMPEEAETVIRSVAVDTASPVFSVREEFGEDLEFYPQAGLGGDYQRWNAATAILTARCMGLEKWHLSEKGMAEALMRTRWPGRWEEIQVGGRKLILDSSHNPDGAKALDQNLKQLVDKEGKPVIVCGVLGLDRARPLIQTVCQYARSLYLVMPEQARASSFEELEALVPDDFKGDVHRSSVRELFSEDKVMVGGENETVVVTGSIYLVGEVLAQLGNELGEGALQDF